MPGLNRGEMIDNPCVDRIQYATLCRTSSDPVVVKL